MSGTLGENIPTGSVGFHVLNHSCSLTPDANIIVHMNWYYLGHCAPLKHPLGINLTSVMWANDAWSKSSQNKLCVKMSVGFPYTHYLIFSSITTSVNFPLWGLATIFSGSLGKAKRSQTLAQVFVHSWTVSISERALSLLSCYHLAFGGKSWQTLIAGLWQ